MFLVYLYIKTRKTKFKKKINSCMINTTNNIDSSIICNTNYFHIYNTNFILKINEICSIIEQTYPDKIDKFVVIIDDDEDILLYISILSFLIENGSKHIIILKNNDLILQFDEKLCDIKNHVFGIYNNKIIGYDSIYPTDELQIYKLKNLIPEISIIKIYPDTILNINTKYVILDNKNNYRYKLIDTNDIDIDIYIYEININSKIKDINIVYCKLLFLLSNINNDMLVENDFLILDRLMDTNLRGELSFKTV